MDTDPLRIARDCFLSMVAEAPRFDHDGDEGGSFYCAELKESDVRALAEALGIEVGADEIAHDTLRRWIAAEPVPVPANA